MSSTSTLITLFILLMINRVEKVIATLQKEKSISVTFKNADFDQVVRLEERLSSKNLTIERLEISKLDNCLIVVWLVSGKKEFLNNLETTLAQVPEIVSFR